MAAFVAKQMIGNKMSAVKGMFFFCFNSESEVIGFDLYPWFIYRACKHDSLRKMYCDAQQHIPYTSTSFEKKYVIIFLHSIWDFYTRTFEEFACFASYFCKKNMLTNVWLLDRIQITRVYYMKIVLT